jgi:hypothetical protein
MREQTTPGGYGQPQTGRIPGGDEPDGRQPMPDQAADPTGRRPSAAQVPGSVDGPAGPATGPAGTPPADPEPVPEFRPESEVDTLGRRGYDTEPEPAGPAGTEPVTPAPADEPMTAGTPGGPGSAPVSDVPEGALASGSGRAGEDTGAVLFGQDEVERFRLRWREVQADFVDDPKTAVQGADRLVEEVMGALSDLFAAHKRELEAQWHGGDHGETEELRVALRRYRSFFDQLLNS